MADQPRPLKIRFVDHSRHRAADRCHRYLGPWRGAVPAGPVVDRPRRWLGDYRHGNQFLHAAIGRQVHLPVDCNHRKRNRGTGVLVCGICRKFSQQRPQQPITQFRRRLSDRRSPPNRFSRRRRSRSQRAKLHRRSGYSFRLDGFLQRDRASTPSLQAAPRLDLVTK